MKLAYLELTSYRVGSHYYGKLKCKEEKEPIELNMRIRKCEIDSYWEPDFMYQVGNRTSKFPHKFRIIEKAIRFCSIFIPDAILVEGDHCTHEPMEILNTPKGVDTHKLNSIWKECEQLGWWDNENKVQKLSDGWFEIIEEYTNEN